MVQQAGFEVVRRADVNPKLLNSSNLIQGNTNQSQFRPLNPLRWYEDVFAAVPMKKPQPLTPREKDLIQLGCSEFIDSQKTGVKSRCVQGYVWVPVVRFSRLTSQGSLLQNVVRVQTTAVAGCSQEECQR